MPDLDFIFHPKSIAVVGASPQPFAPSNVYFFYPLLMYGYPGKIYPVHPTAEQVHGLKTYRTILDIPETVDHVISAIPALQVPQLMRDCVAAKVKAITVFTAGFSETGNPEGMRLEREILEIARQGGIRMIGPNCLGLHCPKAGLSLDESIPKTSGKLGFISQSGGNARDLIVAAAERQIFISKGVSFGNAVDLNESDFLEYLTSDDDTEVIAAYIEGIKEPARFFKALRAATRAKPVIMLKGGVTEAGTGAVASHTGALAGRREVWDTLCRQAGVTQVHHLEELLDSLMAFMHLKPPRGRRVGVIGMGGGASVLAADECESAGLEVPVFPEQVRKALLEFTPSVGVGLRNPLDSATGVYMDPSLVVRTVKTIADWEGVDFLFMVLPGILAVKAGDQVFKKHVQALEEAAKDIEKPIVIILRTAGFSSSEKAAEAIQADCLKAGFPVFRSIETAARAVSQVISYHEHRRS